MAQEAQVKVNLKEGEPSEVATSTRAAPAPRGLSRRISACTLTPGTGRWKGKLYGVGSKKKTALKRVRPRRCIQPMQWSQPSSRGLGIGARGPPGKERKATATTPTCKKNSGTDRENTTQRQTHRAQYVHKHIHITTCALRQL